GSGVRKTCNVIGCSGHNIAANNPPPSLDHRSVTSPGGRLLEESTRILHTTLQCFPESAEAKIGASARREQRSPPGVYAEAAILAAFFGLTASDGSAFWNVSSLMWRGIMSMKRTWAEPRLGEMTTLQPRRTAVCIAPGTLIGMAWRTGALVVRQAPDWGVFARGI